MDKEKTSREQMTLVGVAVRTSNANEMIKEKGKISKTVSNYIGKRQGEMIKNRKSPGVVYACYTDFESDANGEYTYFLGEEVTSAEGQDLETFQVLEIPKSTYMKIKTDQGMLPKIVLDAWGKIWAMSEEELGGKRAYKTDFEVYDFKAINPISTQIDIFVGIE